MALRILEAVVTFAVAVVDAIVLARPAKAGNVVKPKTGVGHISSIATIDIRYPRDVIVYKYKIHETSDQEEE